MHNIYQGPVSNNTVGACTTAVNDMNKFLGTSHWVRLIFQIQFAKVHPHFNINPAKMRFPYYKITVTLDV